MSSAKETSLKLREVQHPKPLFRSRVSQVAMEI